MTLIMPRRLPQSLVTLIVALSLTLGAWSPAEAGTWKRLDVEETETYALRYLPTGLDPSAPAPVVVFLHGSGATPGQWKSTLQPLAEQLDVVLLVPKSISDLGFGVGADDATIAGALELLEQEQALDSRRIGLAGHSAGGAYALVLAYAPGSRFSGAFSLSAPYRTVLEVADPDYTAPAYLYYSTGDFNFQGASYEALRQQLERLDIPLTTRIEEGFDHSSWPPDTLRTGFEFLLQQRYGEGPCEPSPTRLCLRDGRFAIEGTWRDRFGNTGVARTVPDKTGDSGMLWFFDAANWEVLVKVLRGCGVNGHYWVFAAATTNVEYTLQVTDLVAGETREYTNQLGVSSPAVTDTSAFATCP